MNGKRSISVRLCIALLAGVLTGSAAYAQDDAADEREQRDNTKTKQAQAVSKEFYEKIQKAQEQVDAENYDAALRIVNSLYNPDKLTEYEQAQALNYLGFIQYNKGAIQQALNTYKKLLAIPELEPQMAKQVTLTTSQLYMMEEQYSQALQALDKWFTLETNPGPEQFILRAQILYNLNRFKDMINPIETGMKVARDRELPVKENWYTLLNFAYYQLEDFRKVRDIQKILLQNWPKAGYWKTLAGAYTELGEDDKLIYAYDAAFTQGMLEQENEFVTMAQLYLSAEVPYKAAKLMQEKMDAGIVTKNEKNYRLLSQAWTLSMEDEKAIPALKSAASLATDGQLDARLASSYLIIGDYGECVSAARKAVNKGGLRNADSTHITLGMCLYNQRKYNEAKAAFRDAAKVPRSQRTAQQWIRVIDADVERIRHIRLAEEAAQKKRKEIEERRAQSGRA